MVLDAGNGGSDGAYSKPTLGSGAHEGVVYTVAGSSGKVGGGSLDHPAMHISLSVLGSVVLDVDGDTLTARFLDDSGAVLDEYAITKG
ncbi:MAG: hypothetical protein H6830_05905 [Planctomycetes bacterium]|nr:hypothetical protein [Planctomycetota bacterium]MCB9909057.1 hypothetical protein [Planctomycetota bacterium]MCB9911696.1 hypothetical protein [Planctomycetota bacterium]HPF13217.1 hypothetical protein [Planctomycetota bacterium]HRV80727.1 hypothetical protein [Planctomycetota bacterium]